jgi:phosphoglycolate phosphatase
LRLFLPSRTVDCRAVVFDKDGTLVELLGIELNLARTRFEAITEMFGGEAAAAWEQAVGANVAANWVDRDGPLCLAPRRDELLVAAAVLYRFGHPWDEARSLALAAYDRADDKLAPPFGGELLPGVAAMLATLSGAGLRLAVATTDRHWRAEAMLSALDVDRCFDAVIGPEDVASGKPAPDMVLAACERLGCLPSETAVVGDSPADLEMSRAAGAGATIGVTTGLNGADRLQPLADVLLPTAASLPGLFAIEG